MDLNNQDISRFDEFFQQSMEDFQPEPPADVWQGVDQAVSGAKAAASAGTAIKGITAWLKVAAFVLPATVAVWWVATRPGEGGPAKQAREQEVVTGNTSVTSQPQDQGNTAQAPENDRANETSAPATSGSPKIQDSGTQDVAHTNQTTSNGGKSSSGAMANNPFMGGNAGATTTGNATRPADKPAQLANENVNSLKVSIEASSKVVCIGEQVEFTNASGSGLTGFRWDFDGETLRTNEKVVSYTFDKQGLYTITLTGTTATGEEVSKTTQVRAIRTQAYFTTEQKDASSTVKFINQSVNPQMYTWDFGDHTAWSHEAQPSHTFAPGTGQTTVTLIVTNGNCSDTFRSEVRLRPAGNTDLFIPNVITPDGDGKNDRWVVKTSKTVNQYHIIILNRYGQTIYEGSDAGAGWNGTDKSGTRCSSGDYFYILSISLDGEQSERYTGLIKLIE